MTRVLLLRFALLFCLFLESFITYGQFVTNWQTTTDNESITIPTTGGGYNYDIDWGDGQTTTGQTGNAIHTYATAGIYTVSITGVFPRIYFNGINSADKIITIEQWGNNQWTSMERAFSGCRNLTVLAIDNPNLSMVTSTAYMFESAESFNQSVNDWDVSNVTNMTGMFFSADSFNQPVDNWDVSNVTNMRIIFAGALSFNQFVNNWNVSNVINMNSMFSNASVFDQPLDKWDISNVTDIAGMFSLALSFNQPIGNWNVSKVTNMNDVFSAAESFNQPIDDWNVSNVTRMRKMFIDAISFNQTIKSWDVSNVTSMRYMFSRASSFNQDLGEWNVVNVTEMVEMLNGTNLSIENYDLTLSGWASQTLQNNVTFGAASLKYCTAESDRESIINTYNWIINNDETAKSVSNISISACNSYTAPDNQVYTSSGIYTAVISNSLDCDSIITIDLMINSRSTSNISVKVCDSYTAPDNQIYAITGIYTAVIPNSVDCDSVITIDLMVNSGSTSNISVTACDSYTAPDNQVYITSGKHTAVIPNSIGCDSTITIDLTITNVDTTISLNGAIVTALVSNATYQWLDCNNNYAVIPDSTNQSFTGSVNGSYAVEITLNGCVDTSACVEITTVGISNSSIFNHVSIYPNPTEEFVTIDLGNLEQAIVRIYRYDGKLIQNDVFIDHRRNKIKLNESSGVYLLEINSQGNKRVFRIIKQ